MILGVIMKKRKLKKSVYVVFLIVIFFAIFLVTISKNQKEKNVEKSKGVVNTTNESKVEDSEKRLSIIAVGDVLIHESVYKDALNSDGTYNFHKMFTEVEDILKIDCSRNLLKSIL